MLVSAWLLLLIISLISMLLAFVLLKTVSPLLQKAGLSGMDLNKKSKQSIPEACGIIVAALYLLALFLFMPYPFIIPADVSTKFKLPFSKLVDFVSALLSICSMVLLGFADDVLNLKWKFKLIFPAVASLPVLMVYYACNGSTSVTLPPRVLSILSLSQYKVVDLGFLYYGFMVMVCIFCTNAINILAGINGLEVGQSIIIGCSIVINNLIQIFSIYSTDVQKQIHFLSLILLIPFILINLPLYQSNKYPAKVFVGDTFCYFSGMTFAVAGLLGHFSKTLCLFFIPQIINFIYSCPQLFHLVPCPRHRLPRLNVESGLLEMSFTEIFIKSNASFKDRLGLLMLKFLDHFKMVHLEMIPDSTSEQIKYKVNNLTLINAFILWFGPRQEGELTRMLLTFQLICSLVAFFIRYVVATLIYSF